MITDEQFSFISQKIKNSGISQKEVQDDLIDHFCCLVEIEMQRGNTFEEAYTYAYQQTTPNGFEEIQLETFFLLNHKKIILMKQFTYISGYLFALSTTAGAFFKIMHFPGANIMLFSGLMGLSFIFLPLLLFNKFKDKVFNLMSEKLKWIFGTLSLMLLLVGSSFKVLHLPGAMILLGIGMFIFGILFLPFLFFRMFKSSQEQAVS
ncbi:hypothetical protein MATR_20770 [Marivirga tractuosa]|uniref:Gliding motility protein GldL-like N-terminal domain-containing protein n=1 Tax=Marivirga tractuosa (strain ATCC 23168 / DSM 4126 / NBRC 15989 / NCIMB 1408 / VKM B-1430 / H-43) TaxID=643867 RepID=E4TM15_MARTH|nr:hypothetical protein [Marivirga tractuosa]ADR20306.1 hypothetical protein Ftrac_0297 [Marivirga tractuosa DSM 4126]BDD15252.1 hypothetical protein MATR_20770 [Marivirga tractuosa]